MAHQMQTVATACMFLATKAEDCFRPLRDVTLVAYELIYKWDPSAAERIKQQKIYNKQNELILAAENLLLVTIAFDISIQHPYIPLVNALKQLKITNNVVAMAAWNLLHEWYKTTLCLQYKPQYIAAASLSIPAMLLNFKLPRVEGKPWWLSFEVSPVKLQEVTQHMLRYFKLKGNVNVTPVDINAMKPSSKIENATSQSSPISILVSLEPREDSAPVASQEQKSNSCKYVQKGTRAVIDKVMLKAASGRDEKQNATRMPQNVMKPTLEVQNATSRSGQSYPTVRSKTGENFATMGGLNQKPEPCLFRQKGKTVRNTVTVNASKCSSSSNIVANCKDGDSKSKTSHVDDLLSKLDVDRIKGALKRRKWRNCNGDEVTAIEEPVFDSDLLLRRELERGVELYAAVKKQKMST
ncbi:unnamed protein product [Amaranthus hypochondriacus]